MLMAEGSGTGVMTMPVLQSLAQARDKWFENHTGAIWNASIVQIILVGPSNSKDLLDLSTLMGERDEYTDAITGPLEPALRSPNRDLPIRPAAHSPVRHSRDPTACRTAHRHRHTRLAHPS